MESPLNSPSSPKSHDSDATLPYFSTGTSDSFAANDYKPEEVKVMKLAGYGPAGPPPPGG